MIVTFDKEELGQIVAEAAVKKLGAAVKDMNCTVKLSSGKALVQFKEPAKETENGSDS